MKTEFNFESIPFSAKWDGTRIIDGWEDAGATSRDLREMFSTSLACTVYGEWKPITTRYTQGM